MIGPDPHSCCWVGGVKEHPGMREPWKVLQLPGPCSSDRKVGSWPLVLNLLSSWDSLQPYKNHRFCGVCFFQVIWSRGREMITFSTIMWLVALFPLHSDNPPLLTSQWHGVHHWMPAPYLPKPHRLPGEPSNSELTVIMSFFSPTDSYFFFLFKEQNNFTLTRQFTCTSTLDDICLLDANIEMEWTGTLNIT